jgi:hypothetical protein
LQPGADLPVVHTWQTAGAAWGQYTITAYTRYNGEASNVLGGFVDILAPVRVFLPVVAK